jgi:hypothetical protein
MVLIDVTHEFGKYQKQKESLGIIATPPPLATNEPTPPS